MELSGPAISVIIPLRNRGGTRLENCLRSLNWQELDDGVTLEIVISDFGSDAKYLVEMRQLAQRHGARLVETKSDEVWNRSRALNLGIQAAKGHYLLCTDADMIFAPNFVARALKEQFDRMGKAFVICRCRDLPQDVAEQDWKRADFESLLARAPYREKMGTGACQFARREFFEKVRGYDEGYVFWGMEDNDMLHRAWLSGLRVTWMHEHTAMLHQWHPSSRGARPFRKVLNDLRYHVTKRVRVKNWRGWGDRPGVLTRSLQASSSKQ